MTLQLYQSKINNYDLGRVCCNLLFRAVFLYILVLETHCLCNKCHSKENVLFACDVSFLISTVISVQISPKECYVFLTVSSDLISK